MKTAPAKFEAGTPNIEGVIGLGAAIEYLMAIGMDNIHQYELKLRQYAVEKLLELDNIKASSYYPKKASKKSSPFLQTSINLSISSNVL